MTGDSVFGTILVVYTLWAIYSGWRFSEEKFPDFKGGVPQLIGKILLSLIIGYVIGTIKIIKWIFLIIAHMVSGG